MSDDSKIEWTDATWNPVTGCTEVSPGCDHCYAKTFAERFRGVRGHHFERGFDVVLRPERLDQPLRWKRPRRIFVNSMSDLFHDSIEADYIADVFATMALAPQHTFQLLTKRHGRMRSLLSDPEFTMWVGAQMRNRGEDEWETWPLPNVWLGVSVENQQWANIRIPALLDTPAAVRFLSCEPLLGPVDLGQWTRPHTVDCLAGPPWCSCGRDGDGYLDWVIVGGESGHGARPMHPDWARSLRDQCTAAGVAFHFKQWGEWQHGSAAPGQHGVDHIIVRDGRHEPSKDHWAKDHRGWWTSDLIRARDRHEKGSEDATFISRVGKKSAGRELDGRTWDEFPAPESPLSSRRRVDAGTPVPATSARDEPSTRTSTTAAGQGNPS